MRRMGLFDNDYMINHKDGGAITPKGYYTNGKEIMEPI
jgi:hypothetical protein